MSSLKDIPNNYPIFEANQVLTNRHLNALFDYLDKHQRLTRTHLVGIGIVCGCEVVFDKNALQISIHEGCGVTSEGYLLKIDTTTYTRFKSWATAAPPYEPFKNRVGDIQELTTNSSGMPIDLNILKNKALVLFVELQNEGLRNCSPNNCDDKGREVTASVKVLLVPKEIIQNPFPSLPSMADVRLRRVDVPRTGLADSQKILGAFAKAIREAESILSVIHTAQTHGSFVAIFGNDRIDNNLLRPRDFSNLDVSYLQNYYDFLDDLMQAYEEWRNQATTLLCHCCSDSALFAQHLILGEFEATEATFTEVNRTGFMSSPAMTRCMPEVAKAQALFERVRVMLEKFDIQPNINLPTLGRFLPTVFNRFENTPDVRITPTKQGTKLSKKAIPYYYNNPDPTLLSLWNPNRTRKNKEKQNLGYFAPTYATEDFVKRPLLYELEPYNFLRVEGHLGQNYQDVLKELLDLKFSNRLPIEIVALRAGTFDENIPVDFSKEKCYFQDLEAVYDAFREELCCSLGKAIINLGNIKPPAAFPMPTGNIADRIPLFNDIATDYKPVKGSLGEFFGKVQLFKPQTLAAPSVMKNIRTRLPELDLGALVSSEVFDIGAVRTSLNSIAQLTTIINLLTDDLPDLDWERFQQEHNTLKKLKPSSDSDDIKEVSDQLTAVITACRLEGLRSIIEDFRRRLKEVKQQQYFNFFLQKHPGIQHKAGVPLGGTFILVYHQDPEPDPKSVRVGGLVLADNKKKLTDFVAEETLNRTAANAKITIGNKAFLLPDDLLEKFTQIPALVNIAEGRIEPNLLPQDRLKNEDEKIIAAAVKRLPDGAVIADFFLPYLCSSECAPVQFVLPKSKPTFSFTIDTCPDPQNQGLATVTIKPQGGTPDYEVSVDGGNTYETLKVMSLSGTHQVIIRDAEGIVSVEKTITIPEPLSADFTEFVWDNSTVKNTYTQTVVVRGGVAPFTVKFNDKTATTSDKVEVSDLKNGELYQVAITDANGCTFVEKDFVRACKEPCGGHKTRSHYLLPVRIQQRTNKIAIKIISFQLENDVLVRDESQDFAPLIKVQDFLKSRLNVKKELWAITDFTIFKDSEDRPQWLGMQIEQFVCQKFKLEIELTENESVWQLVYTSDAVRVVEDNRGTQQRSEFDVPAFEIQEADLCAANTKFQTLASEDFKIGYNRRTKTAISDPEDSVKHWYWQKATGEKTNEPKQNLDTGGHLLVGIAQSGRIQIETITIR